ncbi:MAG: 16S rRNA (uracil(1498)-N(3))-methyltransferase [Armatimonadota bacterium]
MTPRLYLPTGSIQPPRVALPADAARYLRVVLRLHEGDEFRAFDTSGVEYRVKLVLQAGDAHGEIVETLAARPGPAVEVTLYQGLPKGKRLPLIIQKCTELGLARVVPVQTARSQVKIDEREAEGKASRWQKIAAEAAEQSGRALPPVVEQAVNWRQALADWQERREPGLLLDETLAGETQRGLRQALSELGHPPKLSVFVGPEGGFAPQEAASAREAGLSLVSMGPRILRTETAAIVICALVMYEYGELG